MGSFDNLDHDELLKMLAERVDDKALLWLIGKWLKAGVLDTDGKTLHPETGTPQGGVISPILANVYLHYALDTWFQKVVVPHCHGQAYLIRFADDFVCAFEYEEDARRFYEVLGKRLGKFGLELSAEKTQIIPFSAKALGKSSFDFLGFEFRWGLDRKGKPHVDKRTARKSLRKSQKRLSLWCKGNRHRRIPELFKALNAKLRGYYTCTHRRCGVITSVYMETCPVSMRSISMPSGRCGNFSIGVVNARVTIGLALIN